MVIMLFICIVFVLYWSKKKKMFLNLPSYYQNFPAGQFFYNIVQSYLATLNKSSPYLKKKKK